MRNIANPEASGAELEGLRAKASAVAVAASELEWRGVRYQVALRFRETMRCGGAIDRHSSDYQGRFEVLLVNQTRNQELVVQSLTSNTMRHSVSVSVSDDALFVKTFCLRQCFGPHFVGSSSTNTYNEPECGHVVITPRRPSKCWSGVDV